MAQVNENVLEAMDKANAREIYGRHIAELASKHPEVVALTADLMGTNKFGDFKKVHPDRFFNVGIAEQNLMSVAAGLALDGKVPFASSFATFASMRAHEQVRSDIAYRTCRSRSSPPSAGSLEASWVRRIRAWKTWA